MSKAGKDAKFYYATDDDIGGTPTWTLLSIVQDAEQDRGRETSEVKNRASDNVKMLVLHKTQQVTVTVTHTPGNAGYEALRDAFEDGSDIAISVMDGLIATVGSEGLQMDAVVTAMKRSEPLSQTMSYDFTLAPSANSDNEPSWVEVSS